MNIFQAINSFLLPQKLQPNKIFLRLHLLCPLVYPIWLDIYNLGHHEYTIHALLRVSRHETPTTLITVCCARQI